MSGGDAQELPRAWGIPYLCSYFLVTIRQWNCFKFEFNSISCFWLWVIIILGNPQQKISFANALITYHNNLVKVVKLLLRVIDGIGDSGWLTDTWKKWWILIWVTPNPQEITCNGRFGFLFLDHHLLVLRLRHLVIKDHAADLVPLLLLIDHRTINLTHVNLLKAHIIHSLIISIPVILRWHSRLARRGHRHRHMALTKRLRIEHELLMLFHQVFLHIDLPWYLGLNFFDWKVIGLMALIILGAAIIGIWFSLLIITVLLQWLLVLGRPIVVLGLRMVVHAAAAVVVWWAWIWALDLCVSLPPIALIHWSIAIVRLWRQWLHCLWVKLAMGL